jgi:hypothetical protein
MHAKVSLLTLLLDPWNMHLFIKQTKSPASSKPDRQLVRIAQIVAQYCMSLLPDHADIFILCWVIPGCRFLRSTY